MHKRFSTKARTRRSRSATITGLCNAMLGAFLLAVICAPTSANAAAPAGCQALQAKYPGLKGKQLVNAINPHTPAMKQSIRRTRTNMSVSTSISASRSASALASR